MSVQADAVPHAMREISIPRSKAGFFDELSRCVIHGFACHARPGRLQCGGLGVVHDLEDALHLVRGFPENKCAADIGLVTFHLASAVDQQNGALADHLWLARPMRVGRVLAHLHPGASLKSELVVSR